MRLQATIFSLAILLSACTKKPEEQSSGESAGAKKKSSVVVSSGSSTESEEGEPKKEGKSGTREERKRKPQVGTVAKGQAGKVVSPFSKAVVDVSGRKAGELVQDPSFPNDPSKQFEVPEGVEDETKTYEVAAGVPGRPGYVFSPYNNKIVDVQGIPEGALVADPTYPSAEKKIFRVPAAAPSIAPKDPGTELAPKGE